MGVIRSVRFGLKAWPHRVHSHLRCGTAIIHSHCVFNGGYIKRIHVAAMQCRVLFFGMPTRTRYLVWPGLYMYNSDSLNTT